MLLTSNSPVEEPPQNCCKEDEAHGILEHELGAQCPVEEACV